VSWRTDGAHLCGHCEKEHGGKEICVCDGCGKVTEDYKVQITHGSGSGDWAEHTFRHACSLKCTLEVIGKTPNGYETVDVEFDGLSVAKAGLWFILLEAVRELQDADSSRDADRCIPDIFEALGAIDASE